MNQPNLQCYCRNCNNVLKEVEYEIEIPVSIESCPSCNAVISNTIEKRYRSVSARSPSVVFKKASKLPKLTFGIPKLDQYLHFFTLNDKVCIRGDCTQKLVELLCVRAQLPLRHGGLSSHVLLVDGANSSDLYQCVDFAQQYELDVAKILDGVLSSRAFTVYQLTNTIVNELLHAIKQHDVKVIIITNLLNYFTNNSSLNDQENNTMLKKIIFTLMSLQDCLVVVSVELPTKYDYLFEKLFSRVIAIKQTFNILEVTVSDSGKQTIISMTPNELEIIQ